MSGLSPIIFFSALVLFVTGSRYVLEFEENGLKYKEKIVADKQKAYLLYDVPKHGDIQASKYLKDYNLRLNILKDEVLKTCYVWPMSTDEPTPENVEEGLKLIKGKFPSNRYLVENDQIFAGGKMDPSQLSFTIQMFCKGMVTMKINRRSTNEMERILKEKLIRSYSAGRTKRAANHFIGDYDICPADKTKYAPELKRCMSCDRADMLDLNCDITWTKYCGYTVRQGIHNADCKKTHDNSFKCTIPSHTRATVKCCRVKCRLSSSCNNTPPPKQG